MCSVTDEVDWKPDHQVTVNRADRVNANHLGKVVDKTSMDKMLAEFAKLKAKFPPKLPVDSSHSSNSRLTLLKEDNNTAIEFPYSETITILNRFVLFRQICETSPIAMGLSVSVPVCLLLVSVNVKMTFVDFAICHQMASLRKLYSVTSKYILGSTTKIIICVKQ